MNTNKTIIIASVVTVIASYFLLDLNSYMTLATLKSNTLVFKNYYAANKTAFFACFMAAYFLQCALSLPGAAVMSLAAGALFGTATGMLCVIIAATLGATAAFLITRYLMRDYVMRKFGSKLEGVNSEMEKRGINYLLFLRLIPVFPFFLTNLAAGVTNLPLHTFFWGTFVGIIPGAFVFINAGSSLTNIESLTDITTPHVMSSLALLGIFALTPLLIPSLCRRKLL